MANELKVFLVGDATKLTKSLNTASSKLKSFGKSARQVGKDLSIKLTLPLAIAGGAAIKMASDFEETESKFNTVFSSIQDQAQKTAETFKESFGLSELAAKDMLSSTGDLLVGFGFAEQEALNLSNQVNSLAVDLASFTNFSGGAKGASEALTKALLGERESIKSLGIAITEADLKTFAAEQGLVFKELDRVAKATLTYQLALKQSSKAVGDFERTQNSFANQFRQLQGDLSDLGVDIGKILLPAATKIIEVFRDVIKRFEGLDDRTKKIIVVVGLAVAAIGPLLFIIGSLSSVLGIAATGFGTLTAVMMANPFVLIGTAIVTLTGLLITMSKKIAPLVDGFTTIKNLFKSLGNPIKFTQLQLESQAEALENTTIETDDASKALDNQSESLEQNTKAIEENINAINNRSTVEAIGTDTLRGVKPEIDPIKGITKLSDPIALLADSVKNVGNPALRQSLDETQLLMSEKQMQFKANANQFNQELGPIFEQGLENLAIGIGEALGSAISTGGNLGQQLGAVLLGSLGGVATQVGKMAIGIGIALEKIKIGLTNLNPAVAIAAGIALIALGSIFKSQSSKIASGMGGGKAPAKFASGGIVSAPTMGLVGEYPGAKSNPEVIAPLDKLKGMIGDRGTSKVEVGGSFTLKGQDLVVALQRANSNRNRIL